MYKRIVVLFLLLIFSCNYPDIDSVPDFKSLNISLSESIDLCKISNSGEENKKNCYHDLEKIINGL